MTTKEQELTFDNITEFFSVTEELVEVVSESIEKLDHEELLYRLDIVESFIEQILVSSEVIADDYSVIIDGKRKDEKILREEVKQQIVLMIIALNNCKDQLLKKIEYEESKG